MQPPFPILLAFLALVLLVSVPQSVNDARHSALHEGSEGLGHLFEEDPTALRYQNDAIRLLHGDLKDLDPQRDALLVAGPRLPYTGQEVDRVELFLLQGGRVLLTDDRGTGRGLLDGLDIGLQIPEGRIFSTSYREDPAFPLAESTGALQGLPETVTLHEPRPILGAAGQALLVSHPFSWFDRNNNGRPDLDEPREAFPLAKRVAVGAGQIIVVGDADLLTRRLAEPEGGEAAQQAFLGWLTEDGRRTLVVDEGHRAQADPLGLTPVLAGDAPLQATLFVAAAALATIILAFRLRLQRVTPRKRPPQYGRPRRDAMERAVLAELAKR